MKSIGLNQFSRVVKIVEMVEKKSTSSKIFECVKKEIMQNNVNYF